VVVLLLINHLKFFQQSLFVEKLKQLDQMKDDFISVASHELRTPLTAIKSYAAMMAKDFQGKIPEKIKKRMDIINFSIQRLEQLINDLLNVSRLEQGKLDFQLSPVNTDEIITEIINQLRVTAEQKQLQLNYNARPDLQSAQSHPDRLREVLLNLIGNAIKYTKQGQVQITQKQENNKLYILIQDTGIGISPEDREKLFQKFSRIRNEQTQDISGTGLGLWITKTIVEKMQGKIYLDSVIGQGTVVTVILPIASP
jgi:signal transduction histidine kinase